MSGKNSIQVAIKVRPLIRNEKDTPWRIVDNSIQLIDSQSDPFYFDHIFDHNATNQMIFDKMAKQIVHSAIKGFNGTIFAYGQTSSGKTYTMMGDTDNPGVMVLAAKEIFHEIANTSDRQFLLRVGYIEIYNEKIYDLLNKKNQDLKIHETSTGIVSVNCEEMIIQCEDDLLNHLIQGNKERTVGETNMNERSSRSHAIFRVIIESRKIDRSDGDDAIIQSVLNLVDLAGSERADQTGATGTRLKEGGHINKSLLFLSNVIKRLSENEDEGKYVSFRDSKLTRILQASLGGNALTSIICTIKPNAVEETQSTLNFALRAKSVKNKPQVNEMLNEATMMKRLEKEIKMLKLRLEEEQRKNQNQSQLKVRQLEQRIKMEDLKIISCNSLHSMRNREKRRRTWCPSSTNLDVSSIGHQPSSLPVPTLMVPSGIPPPTRLQAPKKLYYNTPLITLRPTEPPPAAPTSFGLPIPENVPEMGEEFSPAELVNFSYLSPMKSPKFNCSLTPKVIEKERILKEVENDLLELRSYTNLENKTEVIHDSELALRQQVEAISQRNRLLEEERLEYLKLKDDFSVNSNNLIEFQKRCDKHEIKLSKLTNANKLANEKIAKYERELAKLKKTNEKLEMENREAVNLDFELKSHKNKSKRRENELLDALNEKEKEITKLTKSLTSITHEKFQNSKNELLQLSLKEAALDNSDGEVCVKCVDLQRLLEENKKVNLEFENLTLEYKKLQLSYKEIEKENENKQFTIEQLEKLQKSEKLECEKLQFEVQNLREKLKNVQLQYEQLTTENSSKQAECMALNRQVEVAREDMLVLEEKFTKLELSWQEQQKLINDIESQYADVQTKYQHLQNQYESLETNRGQSQTDCQRLEQENIELQTEIGDLKKKVQDAQQKLLETVERTEESTKDEQQTMETSKLQQENENLKQQLLEIQTQLEDLQKEYDDLSNQLMDNLQECDYIKQENSNLRDKLKSLEDNKADVCKAEAEINELKTQLEKVLTTERKSRLKTPSPGRNSSMRSSGVCVDEEDNEEEENLFKKFSDLAESFIEIELEHTNGKTKVFKSASKNSTPNNYKLYLRNILGVSKIQKDFQMEIENIHLQGSFKNHSFHIVELSTSLEMELECDVNHTNGCDNSPEYIEKLKQEIEELYKMNEQERQKNTSLLESYERDLIEMREQIRKLSDALTNNQQTIEVLEKEKADITLVCEELQEKVNCTLNGSFNSLMNITANTMGTDFNKFTTDEKLKELESWKLRERELLETYDSQMKMLEDLTQRNLDMESELQVVQEQLEIQERKNNQLQLEMIEKLELSANEYRDNMKKYNKEWEESRETYEQTIQDLNKQLDNLKQQLNPQEITTPKVIENIKVFEVESNFDSSKELVNSEQLNIKVEIESEENQEPRELIFNTLEEHIDYLKQEVLKLKEAKQSLETRVHSLEEQLENLLQESQIQLCNLKEQLNHLNEENLTHCEEKTLLDSKLISLEEHLRDAQELNKTMRDENRSLETQVSDLKQDSNCIPILHDKVEELSAKNEQLQMEYKQIQQKLRDSELQMQEAKQSCETRVHYLKDKLVNLQEETKIDIHNLEELREDENVSLREEKTLLDSKLTSLEEHLSDAQEINKLLRDENSALKTRVSDLEVDANCIPILREKLEKLIAEKEQLQMEYKQIQQKLLEAELQIHEFCKEDTNRAEMMELLENRLTSLKPLEDEKLALMRELETLQKEYHIVQESFEILKENHTLYEQENKTLILENSSLKESADQLNSKINDLELEITKLKQEVEHFSITTTEMELEKSELQHKLEKLSNCSNELKLKQELENHSAATSDILSQKSKLQEELENLLTKTNEMELENSKLKQQLEKLSTERTDLELEKSKLKQELENHLAATTDILSQKSKLQEELENLLTKTNEMEMENSKLKQQLEKLSAEITDLELEKSKLKQELENYTASTNDKVQEELENLLTKSNEVQLENSELKHKLEKLTILTTDYELEKLNLEEKLQQINKIYELLKLEHVKLETQLRELTEEKETLLEQTSVLIKEKKSLLEQALILTEEKKSLLEQTSILKEEKKSLLEQTLILTEEKTTLEEQLKCLKEKEKTEELLEQILQEKSELTQNLRLTNEKLQKAQQQLEEMEKEISFAKQEKRDLYHDLKTLQDEVERVKDKATKEKLELHQDLEQLQEEIKKEKEKAEQEKHEIHHSLQSIQDSLSQQIEEIKTEKEKTKQENCLLQNELETLKANYSQTNQAQQKQQEELAKVKQESLSLQENLQLLNEEKLKLQEKLEHYQHLQEEKCKLEVTINALKTAQSGAVNILHKERDTLRLTLKQYELENQQYKEKQETLQLKLISLSQQLHESHSKVKSYEELLQEHEEVEKSLNNVTETNKHLQQQLMELNNQTIEYLSTIENQSLRLENLHLELHKHKHAEQLLQTKLNNLNETLEQEKSSIQRNHQDHKSSLEELQLKYNSLLASNTQLEEFNKHLKQQHYGALENLNKSKSLQDELDVLKVKYEELQNQMKITVEEAGRCSQSLRNDLEHHKQLLEKQLHAYNSLRSDMDTKEQTLKKENIELSNTISTLQNQKQALEEKLREITIRNFEQDLQRQTTTTDTGLATANNSFESNTSFSPKGRRSLERLGGPTETKATNLSIEEKLIAMQNKNTTTAERKNRRLSTHDERRRQSFWGVSHEKETMTDPVDKNCKCIELDAKLKECERNLFIKSSQVTALNMALKNHPLKEENAALMKRVQEVQDKSRIEIKRCKQKLYEQTAKAEKALEAAAYAQAKSVHAAANAISSPVIPRIVADAESQTDCDLNASLHMLQGKYNDIKNICRYRLSIIKDLEKKVSEKENSDTNAGLSGLEAAQFKDIINKNESLKNELNTVKDKYEKAKLLLTTRRDEILKLRAQLVQLQQ